MVWPDLAWHGITKIFSELFILHFDILPHALVIVTSVQSQSDLFIANGQSIPLPSGRRSSRPLEAWSLSSALARLVLMYRSSHIRNPSHPNAIE